jgi:hypothetical protein
MEGREMGVSHTNRKGDIYYLHTGKTKSGQPRYHFSKKAEGNLAPAVPEGYEVCEKPNGQVFLCKRVEREVTAEEIELVKECVRRHSQLKVFLVEAEKDAIIVHTPDQGEADLERLGEELAGPFFRPRPGLFEKLQCGGSFSPAFRFVVRNKETRSFAVQRRVFRGEERWSWDLEHGKLEALATRYAPHLGRDSFYELM